MLDIPCTAIHLAAGSGPWHLTDYPNPSSVSCLTPCRPPCDLRLPLSAHPFNNNARLLHAPRDTFLRRSRSLRLQQRPLALIPVPQLVSEPAKPISPIPYFPNYVSYLKTAHDPEPPRFAPEDPNAYDCIIGEPLDVVVAVRMPRPPVARETPLNPDDDDVVMDEWGGLELGIASWQVVSDKR